MNKIKNYRITVGNYSENIVADKVEYNPNNGQTLFFLENDLLHIAPPAALVINTSEENLIKAKFEKVKTYIDFELKDKIGSFWEGFLERNKTYDVPDDKISIEDRIERRKVLEKIFVFDKIRNIIDECQ
ncbi:MAG: hypothetical protein KG003_10045 [Bacteroidetes bacterium]|nr:hypothetical protein [Bacteroidota bacterium]